MQKDIVFSVFCPYLKRSVILTKATWYGKIAPSHPEVENRLELIKEILSKDDKSILQYRAKGDPKRIALFKECPHLLPLNRYIKIAIRLISEEEGIVTTVHGKYDLPSGMERTQ